MQCNRSILLASPAEEDGCIIGLHRKGTAVSEMDDWIVLSLESRGDRISRPMGENTAASNLWLLFDTPNSIQMITE